MRLILLPLLLLAAPATAEVYKCVQAGRTVYADRPCHPGAEPARLPALSEIPAGESDDLGRRHEERLQRQRKARDAADAAFLKAHAEQAAREKAVRAAIIDHRVIEGMHPGEVDSALGSAEEILPDGTRRYRRDGQRITVRFRDGQVSGISTHAERDRK